MKNKFFITAGIITVIILVLILVLSPRNKSAQSPPQSTSYFPESTISTSILTNLSEEKRSNAIAYLNLISDRLPFYIESFPTKSGIETSLHIFKDVNDPPELTRFEIYGLSYLNKDDVDEKQNFNVAAFKETFMRGLDLLREAGIDPKQLIFVYSDHNYIQQASTEWVAKLGLLR